MMGKVDAKTQLMMVVSGLRGIVALALVMAMPSSSQEQIAAATMFVIFWTNIVLGGLTATLVPRLFEEHDGADGVEFTDEQAKFLVAIDSTFDKWADKLLIYGSENINHFNVATEHGKRQHHWQKILVKAKLDALRNLSAADDQADSGASMTKHVNPLDDNSLE